MAEEQHVNRGCQSEAVSERDYFLQDEPGTGEEQQRVRLPVSLELVSRRAGTPERMAFRRRPWGAATQLSGQVEERSGGGVHRGHQAGQCRAGGRVFRGWGGVVGGGWQGLTRAALGPITLVYVNRDHLAVGCSPS